MEAKSINPLDIKVIEDEKNKFVFEIIGESHTIPNVLKKELWNDPDVSVSGYNIEHPLVANPRVVVETKKKDAKKAVIDAIARVVKSFDDISKQFAK